MLTDDRELTRSDVQQLSSADEVASFFLNLGYSVDARIEQTPAALGISADSLARRITHIERIADQDEELQVYLFEMKSMRVADRQALARHFGNLSGEFLLILTSDYDTLDFVLLERTLPQGSNSGMGRKRVAVQPHVLTVDRQNPDAVTLRVLRRFSYTEADPQFQFDKLLSAYTVAEWSEPLFNNRALFSDYYLNQRLRETKEWQENPQPIYRSLRSLLLDVRPRLAGEDEATTRGNLIEPALDALGFAWRGWDTSEGASGTADFRLFDPEDDKDTPPLALCLTYKWNRYLDGRDETRDSDRPNHNPGARVVSALESGEAPYAILTNGKLWRLYAARAHSRATNYYEVDLEETLSSPDREEAIRYFWLLFRGDAFVPRAEVREGEIRSLCFLDRLVEDSQTYAKELGERLKSRVFEEIFPHLAAGFIEQMRRKENKDVEIGQDRLDIIYQGTLTFLYRMMFVLYAESRDLLPVKDQRGYWEVSLSKLKGEIAGAAGDIIDTADDRLRRAYAPDSTVLYDRLSELFMVIDQGAADLNVPRYNGGLFLTAPSDDDASPEAGNARFLRGAKIPDRYLALGLNRLARDVDAKTQALVMIDFKSLGVRQLGSIYEGLLEFKLRIAPQRMAIVGGKRTEEIIPYREAKKKKRRILTEGRGENRRERTLPKGAVYLENTRQERKATGSYYTPEHIVKYIVEQTVGPVLNEKVASLRPRLRELERQYRTHRQNAMAKSKLGRYEDPEKFWNNGTVQELAYEILDIKVLDPAMGSGHFLVEAVDFITDRLLHFLNGFPDNPVRASLERTRQAILAAMDEQAVAIDPDRLNDVALLKRQVLKRCVYGVDLNPMAVELAKVSLWLDAFTLGAPLSFLDHHLRYGNSLIGTMARDADREMRGETAGQATLWGGPFEDLLRQAEIMLGIGQLADATMEQVHESANLFRLFEEAAKPYKQLLDVFVIRHFGEERAADFLRLYGVDVMTADRSTLGKPYREVVAERERLYDQHRFFHWDLEFPEVFVALKSGNWRDNAGFEAVVGNPPYVSAIEWKKALSQYERPYWKTVFESARGAYDAYVLFLELGTRLARPLCRSGLITPNKYLSAPYGKALRTWLSSENKLVSFYDLSRANPFDDPAVYPIVTIVERGRPSSAYRVRVSQARNDAVTDWFYQSESLTSLPENLWGFLLSNVKEYPLLPRIVRQSDTLGEAAEVVASSTASEADRYSKFIVPRSSTDRPGMPIVHTGSIDRYGTQWGVHDTQPFLVFEPSAVPERRMQQYRRPKLIFAKLALRIEAMCDTSGRYASANTNFAFPRDYQLQYYGALCNSLLLTWVYHMYFGALMMGGGYLQFQAPQLRLLPIRRIRFTTPTERRAQLAEKGRKLYQRHVAEGHGDLTEFVGHHLEASQDDVVHDLLGFLGEQMVELNEQRQAETKRFLEHLEERLGARIDGLGGNTAIRRYAGDYQKGEGELPFEELLERLHNNRSGIRANLSDPAFVARLRREYEASLAVLVPIKQRLAYTDRLIDQVVYRLYGLTEEEIEIVEGRA